MAVNVPRFETVNLGNVLGKAEQVKSQRTRNKMLGQEFEAQQNIIAKREKAREIRQKVDGMPAQIEALENEGLFDQADKLRQSYLSTRVKGIQMIDTMRDAVDESNWKEFRADMIQSGAMEPSTMPTEYDPNWFREQKDQQAEELKTHVLRWGQDGRIVEQMIGERGGERVWEGDPYETTGSQSERRQGGEGFQMKASDTNSIRGAAAELYGGFYDPRTQRYSGLNREQQQQVAALNEEASRIYRERAGRVGHTEAVAEAARKQGINIDQITRERRRNPNDPLNILGSGPGGGTDTSGVGLDFRRNPPHDMPR